MGVRDLLKHSKAVLVTKGNATVCVYVDRIKESGMSSVFCLEKAV